MDPGRARGRASSMGRGALAETEATYFGRDASLAVAENEPAMRGRGGVYRLAEALVTIPPGVTVTTGDGQGNMKIVTNYFRLVVPKDQVVHSYRVDFEPQVESVRVRRGLIYENRAVFDRAYVFDGGSEIKSLCMLNSSTVTVNGQLRDGGAVTITIKYTSTVSWGHPEMLRLYNTQMRRNLEHLGFIQVGRDYYTPEFKKLMKDQKLEIWPGVLTAIAEHDGGILMVNDMINKIIRQETALDALKRVCKNVDRNRIQEVAKLELVSSIVMTQYNNKTYRVEDVIMNKNPADYTFERRGATISLRDYYRDQYSLTCSDERQPLLLAKPTERQARGGDDKEILLIPEFCIMTGLTKQMAEDFQLKRALGEMTRLDPLARAQALTTFIRKLNNNDKVREEMRGWGLTFSENLVELNGRAMPQEKIIIGGDPDGVLYQQRTGNFEREMRSKRMKTPVRLEQWAVIAVKRDKGVVDEFFDSLRRICGPLGVEIGSPKVMPIDNDRIQAYQEAMRNVPAGAKMVVIIVPNNNAERYSTVKRHFCVDSPCPSQVITTRVLSNKKNLMSVATKILIQISTKMGAQPWGIAIPPKGCMIVGYDTYHDSQRKGFSVGGFVCTTNPGATSWFSRTSYHQNRDELCGNFAQNFRAGLKNWSQRNNGWPERIVIYRDGVSEGQIPFVYNIEMKQMQDVLKEREGLEKTQFVFIIVTKRVNARFFWRVGERELQNPHPGTVIDTIVTRKQRYDFYLISQSVRQGTVNPTMYNIIADNTNWRPLHHQQLAYKLCHMYYNWAGTITVPAPCQYAHKLAYLTGTALHKEHDHQLSHTLFFL